MTTFTLGQLDRLRPTLKGQTLDKVVGKMIRALSCAPQGVDATKLGYEVSPVLVGKNAASPADGANAAPRFTMMDALVIEGLATGFVRF